MQEDLLEYKYRYIYSGECYENTNIEQEMGLNEWTPDKTNW